MQKYPPSFWWKLLTSCRYTTTPQDLTQLKKKAFLKNWNEVHKTFFPTMYSVVHLLWIIYLTHMREMPVYSELHNHFSITYWRHTGWRTINGYSLCTCMYCHSDISDWTEPTCTIICIVFIQFHCHRQIDWLIDWLIGWLGDWQTVDHEFLRKNNLHFLML